MTAITDNFLDRKRQYACKDPYKIALLQCMGAVITSKNAADPQNVVFVLEHEHIAVLVDAIHNGTVGQHLKEGADKFAQYHREIMGYIRDVRNNRG